MISNEYQDVADYGYIRSQSINLAPLLRRFFYAAQPQAEAGGSPGEIPECPQLSLSVRRTNDHGVQEDIDDMVSV